MSDWISTEERQPDETSWYWVYYPMPINETEPQKNITKLFYIKDWGWGYKNFSNESKEIYDSYISKFCPNINNKGAVAYWKKEMDLPEQEIKAPSVTVEWSFDQFSKTLENLNMLMVKASNMGGTGHFEFITGDGDEISPEWKYIE
jgi:hypothetical protein